MTTYTPVQPRSIFVRVPPSGPQTSEGGVIIDPGLFAALEVKVTVDGEDRTKHMDSPELRRQEVVHESGVVVAVGSRVTEVTIGNSIIFKPYAISNMERVYGDVYCTHIDNVLASE